MIRTLRSTLSHVLHYQPMRLFSAQKNRKLRHASFKLIFLIAGASIVLTAFISARALFHPVSTADNRVALAASQRSYTGPQTELITLRRTGFDPRQITRPQKQFVLAVDNLTGQDEIVLRLDREAGNRLQEVRVPKEKLNWRVWVDLPPGNYLLTEARHPNWVCRITITPR